MILADTSAWVELDRATGSPVHRRMLALIAADGPLAVTDPVRMELLAGAVDDARHEQLRRLLSRFALLPVDAAADFDAASRTYRLCRRAGFTPRGMLDCVIASVAWRTGASLLCRDADLVRIAPVLGVRLDEASQGA